MSSIETVRHQIDEVDEVLVQLIEKRAALVKSLIALKLERNVSVRVPEREQAIVKALYQRHAEFFTVQELEAIYRPIFDACVRIQNAE